MAKKSKPLIRLSASSTTTRPQARLAKPHPGQERILNRAARFTVVSCGRRFGKTELAKLIVTEMAWRGKKTWWLAPTYLTASQVWRDLKAALTDTTGIRIRESEERIDFSRTGGMIAIRSTHYPDNLRGMGLDFVVLDEAAYMHPSIWGEVVRPMLLETQGGALFLSTPRGKNWFWDIYKLGFDPLEGDWRSFQFNSDMNPLVAKEELDSIRRTSSDRTFREEYLAEFMDDTGQVFRGIQAATTAPDYPIYQPEHDYIIGCDWAKEGDYSCYVVIDATGRQMVALDRFNQIGWLLQLERLQSLVRNWHPRHIWAEANSMGSVLIDNLLAAELPVRPFVTTAYSKTPLIEGLALAIERQELALQTHEVLLNELASYRLERLQSGGYRYSAPAGLHDDTVMALALAWHGVGQGGMSVEFA
jgi:hypothetical protein